MSFEVVESDHLTLASERRDCIVDTLLEGRQEELRDNPFYKLLVGPPEEFVESVYILLSTGKPDLSLFYEVHDLYEKFVSYCFRLNSDRYESIFIQENLPGYQPPVVV